MGTCVLFCHCSKTSRSGQNNFISGFVACRCYLSAKDTLCTLNSSNTAAANDSECMGIKSSGHYNSCDVAVYP